MSSKNFTDSANTPVGGKGGKETLTAPASLEHSPTQGSSSSSLPLRASFMGIPLELRLQIYDYLLSDELSISCLENPRLDWLRDHGLKLFEAGESVARHVENLPSVVHRRTEFGKLLSTSHNIRRELMRHALVRRKLFFDFVGAGDMRKMFKSIDAIRLSAGWLAGFSAEEKGLCEEIHVQMTFGTFQKIENHDTEPNDEAKLWENFCKSLPSSKIFGLRVQGGCCTDPHEAYQYCTRHRRSIDKVTTDTKGNLSSSRFARTFVDWVPKPVTFHLYLRYFEEEEGGTKEFNDLINSALSNWPSGANSS